MNPPAAPADRKRRWLLPLTLAGVALTASLCAWQLDRAGQKRALEAAITQRASAAALDNAGLAAEGAQALHRRVRLQGHWLAERSVWLENRPMDGRVGFFLVTPLQLRGRAEAVLVQRGWAPRDPADRSRLPALADEAGEIVIEGRMAASPSRLYQLGEAGRGRIRQNLDPAAYARETGLTLLPLTVLQASHEGATPGLQRDWPAPAVDLHKHYGYAAQWAALSVLQLGLYVWFQVLRPRRAR
ncbi:SURF1 family protein [Pelomonas sp. APW6]|uniref:SURF1-like protein n=1 Tax=Roseateles subflavus TaxID=3053353 RepID=A0ABT7LIX7_9BURK|nr:SURF1 family protein [Pelomonas sp. APW6]MDL5032825.1 SURF1 family protein [Pelomonas sp. APW6]